MISNSSRSKRIKNISLIYLPLAHQYFSGTAPILHALHAVSRHYQHYQYLHHSCMVLMGVVSLEALLHHTRHVQQHRECVVKPKVKYEKQIFVVYSS